MTVRQRGWLLPPAALILVAGVFLGRNTEAIFLPVVGCFLALLAVLLLKGRGRFAACLVFSLALGTAAGCIAFHPVLPSEGDYTVHAVISDDVSLGSFGQVRVYLSDVLLNDRPLNGGAYWTFYSDDECSGLQPGKSVFFNASLYHPGGAENPDGYNFRETLLQRGVTVGLYGCDHLIIQEPDHFSLSGKTAAIRHQISDSLIAALGEETGSYAAAFLLGRRSLIPSEDREAFTRLGIAHILSVSGFHVGLLISALAALFRLLRLRPSVRIVSYAFLLTVYAALCGMSQPVIRASILLLLSREGQVLNRPRSGIHLLSAALFIMTLFSPVQVTSASFQLTFCAVFGLIWFSPLLRHLQRIRGNVFRFLLESVILTFGIQLGILFPELMFFQRLPLLVFLINLPAMLVFGFLITLFWLVLFLLPFPALIGLLSSPLSAVTGALLAVIRKLSAIPGLTLWIHMPTLLTALGLILVFAGFCAYFRCRLSFRAVSVSVGTAILIFSLLPLSHHSSEYIQFSDGNADAAVLWDQDKVFVFDTGEDDGVISSFLRKRRLTPDAVILTHLHADHAGGLHSMINDEIPVRLLFLPAGAEEQLIHPDFIALLNEMRNAGTEIRFLSRGDVIPLPSGKLTVLWPEKGKVRPGQNANHYSLVTRIVLKESSLLQAGDLSGAYESYCSEPADILKAAHHGSASSTGPSFLQAVSPSSVLLSCQRFSRLQEFRERIGSIPVYGTPECGAVTVRFEENGYTVIPFIAN